jgi:hypothetical protein
MRLAPEINTIRARCTSECGRLREHVIESNFVHAHSH